MHLQDPISLKEFSGVDAEVSASRDEVVLRCCLDALRREEAGDYDTARMILSEFWSGVGETPKTEGLGDQAKAELLLRAGALSGKIGHARQLKGAQEAAKDLISHSSRLYEQLDMIEKITEAQLELAICYLREGGLDEARDTLKLSLQRNSNVESEQRLKSVVTLGIVEHSASRYHEVLRLFGEVAPFLNRNKNHLLRGAFHNHYAMAYKNLGQGEGKPEYIDRAFIEYSAAGYHFEQAGHTRYQALIENNLGYLFLTVKKPLEAHQHLNRARALFVKLRDKGSIAQVDETRARAFLAQGLYSQAETTVRTSVRTLEEGDEKSLLAEALTTHGTALARLDRFERAYAQLKRAFEVASQAGDNEKAGLAALTIVESLSAYVPVTGLRDYYRNAESMLASSQSASTDDRLGKCARKILGMAAEARVVETTETSSSNNEAELPSDGGRVRIKWSGRSLEEEVLRYEGELIHQALESVGGSVTRAARMLGITHQGLAFILNGRHKSLLSVRTPVRRRRKSIFRPQQP